mgnify:CR=1 FL=1|tara:strand:+ start:615 stop:1205 length:591 start_codon:yes stop_codon:yes gene_type:complete
MHPELLSLSFILFATSCSPGPNNIVASYSAFNFGIIKTFPHILGVVLGFTSLVFLLNFGLINIFETYPLIQKILKFAGSIFLLYIAYKISFSKTNAENKNENPVKFIETFTFQFLNPKGVIVAIIVVSTYVESGPNYINYSMWVIGLSFFFAVLSILFWTFIGKFLRKFATNEKFIKWFNYIMSIFLLICIASFYY